MVAIKLSYDKLWQGPWKCPEWRILIQLVSTRQNSGSWLMHG